MQPPEDDKTKIINMVENIHQLLESENEEEIENKIKEYLKPFSSTLKTFIKEIEQTKKEKDIEIEDKILRIYISPRD